MIFNINEWDILKQNFRVKINRALQGAKTP
jgi:hypothetical protein